MARPRVLPDEESPPPGRQLAGCARLFPRAGETAARIRGVEPVVGQIVKDEIATFTIAVAAEAGEFAGGGKPGGRRRQRDKFRAGSDAHEFERIVFEQPVAKRGARLHGDEPAPALDVALLGPFLTLSVEDLVVGAGALPEGFFLL